MSYQQLPSDPKEEPKPYKSLVVMDFDGTMSNGEKFEKALAVDNDGVVHNALEAINRSADYSEHESFSKESFSQYDADSDMMFVYHYKELDEGAKNETGQAVYSRAQTMFLVEDLSFQKIFFDLQVRHGILPVSASQAIEMKDTAYEAMYYAYDQAFGENRQFLRKESTDAMRAKFMKGAGAREAKKEQLFKTDKTPILKELENQGMKVVGFMDDREHYQESAENAGYAFFLVPSRDSKFTDKASWDAARAARNQYMFDLFDQQIKLGHMTVDSVLTALDAIPMDDKISAARKEEFRQCFYATATYKAYARKRLLLSGVMITAVLAADVAAGAFTLAAGAIAVSIVNTLAVCYLVKNNYHKTAASVAVLNTAGMAVMLFASANVWNPVGWAMLGLAAVIGVVGCIHAKYNQTQSKQEVEAASVSSNRNSSFSSTQTDVSSDTLTEKNNSPYSSLDSEGSAKRTR